MRSNNPEFFCFLVFGIIGKIDPKLHRFAEKNKIGHDYTWGCVVSPCLRVAWPIVATIILYNCNDGAFSFPKVPLGYV